MRAQPDGQPRGTLTTASEAGAEHTAAPRSCREEIQIEMRPDVADFVTQVFSDSEKQSSPTVPVSCPGPAMGL